MSTDSAILSWMLAIPAAGGVVVFALPVAYAKRSRAVAMAFLGATLVVGAILAASLDWSAATPLQAAAYQLAIAADGLSMPLILLTAALGLIAAWAAYGIKRSPRGFFALLLWAVAGLLATFAANSLLLFFVALELSLFPFYFLIANWGGPSGGAKKEYAASKFFLFSIVSATLLLIVLLWIGPSAAAVPPVAAFWLLLVAFGIKAAIVPLHTWLSDALTEAPTPVAMLLVALVTKLGLYGFLRVLYPLFPGAVQQHSSFLAGLALVAIFYGSLAALAQKDLRRILAFALIAQAGYTLLGIAILSPTALLGASFHMVGQALPMAMLIYVTGMIADRTGHADLRRLGGLAGHMPTFSGWAAVAFLAAMNLPTLSGFPGQFLILLGSFSAAGSANGVPAAHAALPLWVPILATSAIVLTTATFLWTYQRIFLGAPKPEHANVARLSRSEKWILATLALAILALGILPFVLLEPLRTWTEAWTRLIQ